MIAITTKSSTSVKPFLAITAPWPPARTSRIDSQLVPFFMARMIPSLVMTTAAAWIHSTQTETEEHTLPRGEACRFRQFRPRVPVFRLQLTF